MSSQEDEKWRGLLLRSAPTFAGEADLPYGFVTGALARLRTEKRQQEELERIGWRALLVSVAALVVTATVIVGLNFGNRGGDLEPGVRSLIQMENIQVS